MKTRTPRARGKPTAVCEILILADGRIFAHNVSPGLAGVLAALNPADGDMHRRAGRGNTLNDELSN